MDCDGSAARTWRLGGTFALAESQVVFGDVRVPFQFLTVSASLGRFTTPRSGWTVSASGIVGGEIEGREVEGGAALGGAYTYLPVFEGERRPFVAVSGIASMALARAIADDGLTRSWTGLDLRLGAMVGKSFLDSRVITYVASRVFAGPVFWRRANEDVTGGDRYHITAGLGLSWTVSPRFTLSAEAMPLGEQAYSGGLTVNL